MACPQAVLWIVKVGGKHFRTIWRKPDDERVVQLIDQRFLPHDFVIEEVRSRRADGHGDSRDARARSGTYRCERRIRHVSRGARSCAVADSIR